MSGESKQIDEDENGPENGGMKSGPCLIAGFHALSCTSPSYYNPYRGVNKNTLSVDMVRLSLTFKGDLAELDSQLEDVKLDIEDEQDRLECLRQRADGVARDVGELRSIAAEVRGWEAAGKAERGAILDRIAAQCDGLASRIRAGVAGIRLKVEELRSRISRPLEYLMRREQPRQQSLDDVLRDAQRAADAWNRDHAAPQRTYRGRAR